jgi:very-short-patch-repair endonuclease
MLYKLGKAITFHKTYIYIKGETDMSADYQNNLLKCELCGKFYKSITNSHLKHKHNMKTEEYKIQFPNSKMITDNHFEILSNWIYSDKNKKHFQYQQSIQKDSEKRKESVRKAVKSIDYRSKHSQIMKLVVREFPDKFRVMFESRKGEYHHHYKKSNWQRWFDKYGKDEADLRLLDWARKNKVPGCSRNTKPEQLVKSILDSYNIEYIHQFDGIPGVYVDFYFPKYNLIIEADGDYWHANPSKYDRNEMIKYPGNRILSAESVWETDKIRRDFISSYGYKVYHIFESDINEVSVLSIISEFDKDIVRTYGKL